MLGSVDFLGCSIGSMPTLQRATPGSSPVTSLMKLDREWEHQPRLGQTWEQRTENGDGEKMQGFLQYDPHNDHRRNCFIDGSSSHNQRIKSWWAFLRKEHAQYWINCFQDTDHFKYTWSKWNKSVFCLYLFLFLFDILSSWFVCQHSGGFPVLCLVWVSSVCLHVIWARAQPESTSSLFGYFQVSGSFNITGFTPRFLRSFLLLPYLHSHYLSFAM